MSLQYLVKLEMFIERVLPLSCYRKKLQNLFHLNGVLQIKLITSCGSIAREGVQNTQHWSELVETATENGVGQAGSCVCGRHLSMLSLIAPLLQISDVCFVHHLVQYFAHAVINWIQIWW